MGHGLLTGWFLLLWSMGCRAWKLSLVVVRGLLVMVTSLAAGHGL